MDASAAKKYQGTGLGLALTKRIVEAQGGKVGVQSTPDKGSIFYAILPRVQEIPIVSSERNNADVSPPSYQEHVPAKLTTERSEQFMPTEGPAILVIEDSPNDRKWLNETLSQAGYVVTAVEFGAEALAQCSNKPFDAITLDLLLPDMMGQEVLRIIRSSELNSRTPVFVVSVIADKSMGVIHPIQDILHKPVSEQELLASLQRAGIEPRTSKTVLVVDDDPAMLKLMKVVLSKMGFRPVCSPDGESGLRAVEEARPDVIVLDLIMPGISGFEFLHRYKRNGGPHAPIIVWTNRDLTLEEHAELQEMSHAVVLKQGWGRPVVGGDQDTASSDKEAP